MHTTRYTISFKLFFFRSLFAGNLISLSIRVFIFRISSVIYVCCRKLQIALLCYNENETNGFFLFRFQFVFVVVADADADAAATADHYFGLL